MGRRTKPRARNPDQVDLPGAKPIALDITDPADIARIAVDGIAAGAYEILAARMAQAALAGGVSALYPQLP